MNTEEPELRVTVKMEERHLVAFETRGAIFCTKACRP